MALGLPSIVRSFGAGAAAAKSAWASAKPGIAARASTLWLGSTGVTATSSIAKASGAAKRSPSPEVQPITRLMSPKSLRSGISSIFAR